MQIKVRAFGILRELIGRNDEVLDLPEGTPVGEILSYYARALPSFASFAKALAISVNHEYVRPERILQEGDEVGLLPPVSGGLSDLDQEPEEREEPPGALVKIVRDSINTPEIVASTKDAANGAAVIFDGVVRNNTRGRRTLYLDYEAYEPMALKQMNGLAREARSRFDVRSAAIIHRLGRIEIGETSVLIVVASAHRAAAFDACRWIIDTLKKTVPIWKKEYFEDGAVWADGEPFPEEIHGREGKTRASSHPKH